MTTLTERLSAALAGPLDADAEADGALTLRHDRTLASLRVVPIDDELELVSLTQVLAWDLPLTDELRARVAEQARDSQLGTVVLVDKAEPPSADIMLRYNFPGTGLSDDALRSLVLLVLEKGAEIRRALTA